MPQAPSSAHQCGSCRGNAGSRTERRLYLVQTRVDTNRNKTFEQSVVRGSVKLHTCSRLTGIITYFESIVKLFVESVYTNHAILGLRGLEQTYLTPKGAAREIIKTTSYLFHKRERLSHDKWERRPNLGSPSPPLPHLLISGCPG